MIAVRTLATLHLKQMKVKKIITKEPNEERKMILEKVGATDVIIPEKEMANKVAKSLISPTESSIIVEMPLPAASWARASLSSG